MRIAHFGTFDVANYGDLLLPLVLEQRLAGLGEIVHVSPRGGPPVWRDGVATISVEQALAEADFDAVVLGGGNLVHALPAGAENYLAEGMESALAYPSLWAGAAELSDRSRAAFCWNAPGVPEKLSGIAAELAGWALSRADYAAVRDRWSVGNLGETGVDPPPPVVPDTGAGVPRLWASADLERAREEMFARHGRDVPARLLAIHLSRRHVTDSETQLSKRLDRIAEELDATPVLLALGPCHGDDRFATAVAKRMKCGPVVVAPPESIAEVAATIAGAEIYIGSSLHGAITATSFATPMMIVVDSRRDVVHKHRGFLEHIGKPELLFSSWEGAARLAAQALERRDALPEPGGESLEARLDEHWQQLRDALVEGRPGGASRRRARRRPGGPVGAAGVVPATIVRRNVDMILADHQKRADVAERKLARERRAGADADARAEAAEQAITRLERRAARLQRAAADSAGELRLRESEVARLEPLERELVEARERAARAEQDAASARERGADLEREVAKLQEHAVLSRQELADVRERAVAAEQDARHAADRQATAAAETLRTARARATVAESEVAELRTALEQLEDGLAAALHAGEAAERRSAAAEERASRGAAEASRLRSEAGELRAQIRALRARAAGEGARLERQRARERDDSARLEELQARLAEQDELLAAGERKREELVAEIGEREAAMARLSEQLRRSARRGSAPGAMRIGFVEPHLGQVGGIRRVLEVSNRLAAKGHEVSIYLPSSQPLECDWMECRALLRHLDDGADDELDFIVFNHEPQWYLLRRFARARYRIFLALSYSRAYEKDGSWESLRFAVDLRLANSAWTADCIAAEIGVRPSVVPTGVDRALFKPIETAKRYPVLCVGDRRPWKGTAVVERACAQLGLEAAKLAGRGLSQAQLAREYSRAEVFAVGSPIDGFGFPGLEALACGVPLVTTDNGGCREYAVHEETALLVPPDDPDAMAAAIARLRSSPELRKRLVRNGLKVVRERFSWDDAADGFERELRQLLEREPEPVASRPRPLRPAEPDPVVTIVVLSYNTLELLMRCVESVRQYTDVPYELIVVDNASEDGSAEYVEAAADLAILNERNQGFSGGFNQGLAAARGRFVFYLNSDTKLPPGWASRLVGTMESHRAGIVFPAVTAAGNPSTVREEAADRVVPIAPYLEPPSGVALLMRTDVSRALGGWNERYEVASGEDTDLCFTVWVNGLSMVLDEAVLVDHVAKASAKQLPDQKARWAENRQRFLERWTGRLDDLPRLESIEPERFEANKRVAQGVAFWMYRYFSQRDEGLKPKDPALVAMASVGAVLPVSSSNGGDPTGSAAGTNGSDGPRLLHAPLRAAWKVVRPLVPATARERYYRRHRARYERIFPERAVGVADGDRGSIKGGDR
jgi:GT2 family glycosyltransferase/polysaccharide pyruvyl transferase WcaK-like protein